MGGGNPETAPSHPNPPRRIWAEGTALFGRHLPAAEPQNYPQDPKTINLWRQRKALSRAGTAAGRPPPPKNTTALSKTSEVFNEATAEPLPLRLPQFSTSNPKMESGGRKGGGGAAGNVAVGVLQRG